MNIEDFVADSLTQICKGIIKAQENTKSLGACISPRMRYGGEPATAFVEHSATQTVSFDLTVEVVQNANKTKDGVNFNIEVCSISTSIGYGSKKENTNTNRDAIHVKFDVPVCWPTMQFEDKGFSL